MTHFSRRLLAASGVMSLGLVLAACSGGGGGSGDNGELTYEDSPLNEYFEALNSMGDMSQEEQQAYYDDQNKRTEELVAACMADLGFEYVPNTNNGGTVIFSEDEDGPMWGTVEYAEQYGYGVFTWQDQQTEEPVDGEEPGYVDPNADIIESMSESELEAWNEALWGAPQDFDMEQDVEEYEYNWEDGGCYGAAQHEVQQDDPNAALSELWSDPRFEEVMNGLNQIYTDAMSDPRMKDLNQSWSSCMADAGFTFEKPEDAANSIYELQNSLWDDHADDPEYTGPTDEETAEFKEQEIKTAVADYTCQEELDFQSAQLEVQFALEREFIEQNKAVLDEFKAAAEALQPA